MACKCLRTGEGQTILLGCVFLFVFMAYYMIQGYAANLYGAVLGSNMGTTLYAVFTVACFVAPAVVNLIGTRLSMFVGILGYAVLVVFSLLYYLDLVGSWLVIVGGAINGVGAALLWTGQGLIMLQYSDGSDGGHIFAVFWSIFNLSAVFGGFITFAYFSNEQSSGNTLLFLIFLALILLGATGTLSLSSPDSLDHRQQNKALLEKKDEQMVTIDDSSLEEAVPPSYDNKGEATDNHRSSSSQDIELAETNNLKTLLNSSFVDFLETVKLFGEPHMARMAMIFWYSGFSQPYQLVTFGNRYFTNTSLGLMISLFYCAEIVGSVITAKVIDNSKVDNRGKAIRGYSLFFAVVSVGYSIAHVLEYSHLQDTDQIDHRDSSSSLLIGGIAMFCWGFADATIQSTSYWRISLFYSDAVNQSRCVGFYKFTQSAGWCIGFALSPSSRLAPSLHCSLTASCCLLGLLLLELPDSNDEDMSKEDTLNDDVEHLSTIEKDESLKRNVADLELTNQLK